MYHIVEVCSWSLRQPCNRLNYPSFMHQSFVITAPMGPGNSGDIEISLCKARVYAQHWGNIFMTKALLRLGMRIKSPMSLVPRHNGDDAEVKTWYLGPGLQTTSTKWRSFLKLK